MNCVAEGKRCASARRVAHCDGSLIRANRPSCDERRDLSRGELGSGPMVEGPGPTARSPLGRSHDGGERHHLPYRSCTARRAHAFRFGVPSTRFNGDLGGHHKVCSNSARLNDIFVFCFFPVSDLDSDRDVSG